ncbi:hypothetical protein EDM27_16500, partial [Staphylococcus aureus]
KLGWFKQGIQDLGRLWNETAGNLDFSWIGKFTKGIGTAWDKTKDWKINFTAHNYYYCIHYSVSKVRLV